MPEEPEREPETGYPASDPRYALRLEAFGLHASGRPLFAPDPGEPGRALELPNALSWTWW